MHLSFGPNLPMTVGYNPHPVLLAAALCAALLLSACAGGAQIREGDVWMLAPPSESTSRALDHTLSQAQLGPSELPIPRATRPDALLASLPEGPTVVALVDVQSLLEGVLSGYTSTGLAFVDADAVARFLLEAVTSFVPDANLMRDFTLPTSIAVAVYEDASESSLPVIVLEGISPESLSTLLPGLAEDGAYFVSGEGNRSIIAPGYLAARLPDRGGASLEPETLPYWSALPSDAVVTVHVRGLEQLPLPARMLAIQLLGGRLESWSAAVALDGAVTTVFSGDSALDPHGLARRSLAILRDHAWDDLPLAPSDEILTLVDLATGAMAGWFEVESLDDGQILRLPAARCGAPWRQLMPLFAVALGVGVAFDVGGDLTAEPARPLMEVGIAPSCYTLAGSSPSISAAFFDGTWGHAGELLAASWISLDDLLRDQLPTLAMLPFALEESALLELPIAQELSQAQGTWILGPVLGMARSYEAADRFGPQSAFAFWFAAATTERLGIPSSWVEEFETDHRFASTLGAGYVLREPWATSWNHDPEATAPALRQLLVDTLPESFHGMVTRLEDDGPGQVYPTDWALAHHRRHGWFSTTDYEQSSVEGAIQAEEANTEAARANLRDSVGFFGPHVEAAAIDLFDAVAATMTERRAFWGNRLVTPLTPEESRLVTSVFPLVLVSTFMDLLDEGGHTWGLDRFLDLEDPAMGAPPLY